MGIRIDGELEGRRLEPGHEMTLFRFVQEALANVHRHAGSTTASVVIELQNGSIHATVADKGRGIPALTLKEINAGTGRMVGVGGLGMKERIRQVGGNLEIRSDRSGTLVVATLPAEYSRAEATPPLNHDFSVESTHLSS